MILGCERRLSRYNIETDKWAFRITIPDGIIMGTSLRQRDTECPVPERVDVAEMDELYTFIRDKKNGYTLYKQFHPNHPVHVFECVAPRI